jgi:hypothetical protein
MVKDRQVGERTPGLAVLLFDTLFLVRLAAPNGAACLHIGLGFHCVLSFLGFF